MVLRILISLSSIKRIFIFDSSLFTITRMLIADEFADISWDVSDTLAMKAPEMSRIFPSHDILRLRKPNLEHLLMMKDACDQLNSEARA